MVGVKRKLFKDRQIFHKAEAFFSILCLIIGIVLLDFYVVVVKFCTISVKKPGACFSKIYDRV